MYRTPGTEREPGGTCAATAAKPFVRLRTRDRNGGFTEVPSRSASLSSASILCATQSSAPFLLPGTVELSTQREHEDSSCLIHTLAVSFVHVDRDTAVWRDLIEPFLMITVGAERAREKESAHPMSVSRSSRSVTRSLLLSSSTNSSIRGVQPPLSSDSVDAHCHH